LASIAISNCTWLRQQAHELLYFILLTNTLALLRVSASDESRARPVEARAAITYMFFPADAAVVNLRRKEAILEVEKDVEVEDVDEEGIQKKIVGEHVIYKPTSELPLIYGGEGKEGRNIN